MRPDEFIQLFPVIGLDRLRIESQHLVLHTAPLEILEPIQKHGRIVNPSHCVLVGVHAVEVPFRVVLQQRLDDLDHIS